MKESIHRYFQLGAIQWMSYPRRSVLEGLRAVAADPDFDAVEVGPFASATEREEAKALLASSHLTVCFGAQPLILRDKLNANALDEGERLRAEEALLHCIDEAQDLGAQAVAIMAGKWEEETREEAFQQLVKTLNRLCSYAGEKGMGINLEVFDYDLDKAVLIGPAPLASRLAKEMEKTQKNFGLLVDLSHIPTTHEEIPEVIRILAPYIRHLHMGNAVVKPGAEAFGDLHPRFGFPEGANDVPELLTFFRALRAEGLFRPQAPLVLSFEVKPWKDEEEDVVLASSKRVLRRAWAQLEEEEV